MDYSGSIFLGLVSLALIATVRPYRSQWLVLLALCSVVLLLHAVSLVNVFIGTLPGADRDAVSFHKAARKLVENDASWPEFSIGTGIYQYILTAGYELFGARKLVGQGLSIVAAAGTLICANGIALSLAVRSTHVRAAALLAMGLYPTFLFHNALMFREPYQLLGLALGLYFTFRAMDQRHGIWLWPALASLLVMGMFHHVLLGVGILVAGVSVLFVYGFERQRAGHPWRTGLVMLVVVGIAATVAFTTIPAKQGNDYINDIVQHGGVLSAVKNYRTQIEAQSPRTSYSESFDVSTPAAVATSVARNYWSYLVQPVGRPLETWADVVPWFSSFLRVLMIVIVAGAIAFGRPIEPKLIYCAIVYLLLTGVWAIGTTNYGQAFRHHAMSDWLLVLMTTSALYRGVWSRKPGPTDKGVV